MTAMTRELGSSTVPLEMMMLSRFDTKWQSVELEEPTMCVDAQQIFGVLVKLYLKKSFGEINLRKMFPTVQCGENVIDRLKRVLM
uniref:Uncharacterized protein n=1 Tax=Caenorhabditis japonica TaxID=281687 RepID=A0A8R1ICQ4_CAEJA